MDDKDPQISSFPVPTILRASNTTQTLKPTEVSSFPGDSAEVAEQYYNLKNAEFESEVSGQISPNWPAFQKATEDFSSDSKLFKPLPEEEDKTWVLSKLLDRIELLEEKVDGLLERIEKYNLRAAHRI